MVLSTIYYTEYIFLRKVLVANPKKPPQIEAILRRNREKLLTFLRSFHNDKEDEQFSVSSHRPPHSYRFS
jgi:hypothetical protein